MHVQAIQTKEREREREREQHACASKTDQTPTLNCSPARELARTRARNTRELARNIRELARNTRELAPNTRELAPNTDNAFYCCVRLVGLEVWFS